MVPIRHISTLKSAIHGPSSLKGPWDILESPDALDNSRNSPLNRKKRKPKKRRFQPTHSTILSDIYGIKRPRLSETNTEDLRKSKSAFEAVGNSSKYLGFDNIFYN